MKITFNGAEREIPDGTALGELVDMLLPERVAAHGAPGRTTPSNRRGIAVALDGDVVARSAWSTTRLASGQHVEILTASQGG